MKTGIIFDLDGTLWNAVEPITESWNEVMRRHDFELRITSEELMQQQGKVMTEIADNLFTHLPKEKRYDLMDECCVYENEYLSVHGGKLYDGVENVFEVLSEKYNVFIVSNCQKGYIETFIKYFGFEKYISDIEDAGNTGLPKSENIKLVVERNHLDKAFYVGDTLGDMNSSDEAGVTFIHASYGFGKVPENRLKIKNIRELPELIKKQLEKDNI